MGQGTPTPPEDHDRVPSPEVLGGRYELLEPIGRGAMSTVYRAKDTALGRMVAVKVIRHDPAMHGDLESMRERFRREAANAAHIPPHPNVVQIYDYGTDPEGDGDFIVMELLDGRDLKSLLRERRFSTPEGVRIIQEAARGLAAGHDAGIVHRDVKPANLLVSQDGADRVRILDFGIAKALAGEWEDDLTQVGGIPHTPAYASPEQRQAGGVLKPASDVYQLGLVAYEVLAGERAFDAQDRERIARGDAVRLPNRGSWNHVPAPVRAVVERALRRATRTQRRWRMRWPPHGRATRRSLRPRTMPRLLHPRLRQRPSPAHGSGFRERRGSFSSESSRYSCSGSRCRSGAAPPRRANA